MWYWLCEWLIGHKFSSYVYSMPLAFAISPSCTSLSHELSPLPCLLCPILCFSHKIDSLSLSLSLALIVSLPLSFPLSLYSQTRTLFGALTCTLSLNQGSSPPTCWMQGINKPRCSTHCNTVQAHTQSGFSRHTYQPQRISKARCSTHGIAHCNTHCNTHYTTHTHSESSRRTCRPQRISESRLIAAHRERKKETESDVAGKDEHEKEISRAKEIERLHTLGSGSVLCVYVCLCQCLCVSKCVSMYVCVRVCNQIFCMMPP